MRRAFRLATVAAAVGSGACGSEDAPFAPPTEESVVGEYTLRDVNGYLPYFIGGNAQQAVYVVAGSLDFRADKTFTDIITTRVDYASGAPSTQQTASSTGTYTLFNSNLALVYTSLDPVAHDTVAVIGPRVQQFKENLFYTYRK